MRYSIVVPCYKVEKYIVECIESVLAQTYTDWELILVNDESPDNTAMICSAYEELDSRIKYIANKHGGASKARNTGIDFAKGEYVVFLDADDRWPSDYLQEMDNIIEKYPSDVCVKNSYCAFTETSQSMYSLFPIAEDSNELGLREKLDVIFSLENNLPAVTWLVAHRLEHLRNNKCYFELAYTCSEELDFFFQSVSTCSSICFCRGAIYQYRQDNKLSMTSHMRGDMLLSRLTIYVKWYKYFQRNVLYDDMITQKVIDLIRVDMKKNVSLYYKLDNRDIKKGDVRRLFNANREIWAGNKLSSRFLLTYRINQIKNNKLAELYAFYCRIIGKKVE